ncbi:MAG: hypothetical protein RJA57_1541 [Bacteroidota bacterium]
MLHPSIIEILNKDALIDDQLREKLGPIWQKLSARIYSYERDIKILEHASQIANEDYELINAQLKEKNVGLGDQLTSNQEQAELLAQFPIVNPNPVIRIDDTGAIEFANAAALALQRIEYKGVPYAFPDFFKYVVGELEDVGQIEVLSDARIFTLHFKRFHGRKKVNFYGFDTTDLIQTRKRAYENFYRLSNFLESTDAVHYIVYRNRSENNFFTSRWPLLFGFNPGKVEDPLLEKRRCVSEESVSNYENALQELDAKGQVVFRYQVVNRITKKIIWLEEEIRKKYDPFLNDEVLTGRIIDVSANELLRQNVLETETRFRQITEAMPVMIWVSNAKHLVTYSNQRTRDFFGKGLEEFEGPDEFLARVHTSSRLLTGKSWREQLDEKKPVEQEFLVKSASGDYHYLLEKAIPRFLPSGEFLGYIGAFFDLTKEYHMNQELEKEKRQLELITNNSNDIVVLTDVKGQVNYISPSVRRIIGFEVAAVVGRSLYDFFCPMCQQLIVPQLTANDYPLNEQFTYMFRLVHENGQEVWVEGLVSSIPDLENEKSLIWHIRDINEQQIAFQKLQQSEETNRLIMNSAMDAIICMDLEGNISFWGRQAETIFGWKAEEAMGRPMAELIVPPELRELHKKGFNRYLSTGEPHLLNKLIEIPALRKDGIQFPSEITIIHVKSDTQNFFCAFMRDVSERKQAIDALKSSEERYRSLFQNMSLGVIEVDINEKILYANDAMEKISGYTHEELIGQNADQLFLPPGSKSQKIRKKEQSQRESKIATVYEIEVLKKDGILANWVISGAPLFDVKGNVKGSVGIHWDVTKIRQMESALRNEEANRAKAILEASLQAEEEQRTVIGKDLHDGVGQMLGYLTLYINMMRHKGTYGLDELDELQKSVAQTLEQVRTLSRTLTPPSIRDLGLRDAVIELIDSYSILKRPVFRLSVYDSKHDASIAMEKKIVLFRVLQELINNAFKYANADSISVRLEIVKKRLVLLFSDDGKGFDVEKVRKGVGLNSMESRIRFHAGDIDIESVPGKGSTITIHMPI